MKRSNIFRRGSKQKSRCPEVMSFVESMSKMRLLRVRNHREEADDDHDTLFVFRRTLGGKVCASCLPNLFVGPFVARCVG